MKKTTALILILLLLVTALPFFAGAESNDADGEKPISEYTLPEAQQEDKVFAGWLVEQDGSAALLPAGAKITPTTDTEMTALFVGMEILTPELRFYGADDIGVRFLTAINAADLAVLSSLVSVSPGTLVAPVNYVKTSGALTPEALSAAGYQKYLEIPADGFYRTGNDAQIIAGSVTGILAENSVRPYCGVGYLTIAYTDGTVGKIYAPADTTKCKNYYDLLSKTVTTGTGFPADELQTLASVLRRYVSVWSESSAYATVLPAQSAYYTPPFTAEIIKINTDEWKIVLTANQGEDFRFDRDMTALIFCGGICPKEKYTITEEGTMLTIFRDSYTGRY